MVPSGHHALLIVGPDRRRLRVIGRGGLHPASAAAVQRIEEAGGVECVGGGIERRIQRGEGVRMVHQVDLHAADIDRAHALRLHRAHGVDRLPLAGEELAAALDIDGPGPGPDLAGRSGRPLSTSAMAPSRRSGRRSALSAPTMAVSHCALGEGGGLAAAAVGTTRTSRLEEAAHRLILCTFPEIAPAVYSDGW